MSWTVETVLKWARKATEVFQNQFGTLWTPQAQINHTFSEVAELNEGLSKGKPPDNYKGTLREYVAEEIWDIVFSAITNAHVLGISDQELIYAFNRVTKKVEERMESNYYAKKA